MTSVHSYIYALRGWLAFVAFTDLGTAIRCFIDDDFLAAKLFTVEPFIPVHPAMTRLFGMWSILNAFILLHCALCIHHVPILMLTMCSLMISILAYVLEVFVYNSISFGMSVVFPLAVNGTTFMMLFIAPPYIWPPLDLEEHFEEETIISDEDEFPPNDWEKKDK